MPSGLGLGVFVLVVWVKGSGHSGLGLVVWV